ncbi:MAG TPA: hypothetical protein VFK11_05050 [Candidatus Saccharimonadales bacterium]|nr:hypothetical protein [Candidatus Saccharimonadales bacterium]
MEAIKIARSDEDSADYVFLAEIGEYKYKVTFSESYYEQLTAGKISPKELLRRSFEFLIEREPPASIMRQFELPVINRYFPEYEDEIRQGVL